MTNLVLTGFMGTGKTSAGRAAAQLLGREFVDMDETIAAREGMPVSEIFTRRGEPYFRQRERELSEELASRSNLVIATGGGTLVDPLAGAAFSNAAVVCLDAEVDEILHRLNGMHDRPLAEAAPGKGRRERIQQLLAARRKAYAQIPVHFNTTGRTVEAAAREIVEWFSAGAPEQAPLSVRTPHGSYPVWLGDGLLDRTGQLLPRARWSARCAVVMNPIVRGLYGERLLSSLRAGGFDPLVFQIPDGEDHKTLDTVRTLYDRFASAHLERSSPVVALGGGVTGDIAGFAGATFMRGVPLIQVPTTLLAMVDASVGGKVGVDHPAGKNLIGAFKFPDAVIVDPGALTTLPMEEFRAGMAEVIKHAVIGDEGLFRELELIAARDDAPVRSLDADLIRRALQVKIDLVERDPFELGVRAHLNLGHTFGHALETLSGFRLRHGYAVAIGLAAAVRLAVRVGWCEAAVRDRIVELLERMSLPTRISEQFRGVEILAAMGADKKVRDGRLRLVLPRAVGRVDVTDAVPPDEIIAALEAS